MEFVQDFMRPLALIHQRGGNLEAALSGSNINVSDLQSMTLPEIAERMRSSGVLQDFVERKNAEANDASVKFAPLFPTIFIFADTMYEKNGKMGGSDLGMAEAAVAWSADHEYVSVDTQAGAGASNGREPEFETAFDPEQGKLVVTKEVVDPNGPNARYAPTMLFTTQSEAGLVYEAAQKNQMALTSEQLLVNPR
jgi:hypothetical protein